MVEGQVVDAVFHALAHEARRGMLQRLTDRDLSVGELAEPLKMSFAAASKHVAVLERAGLVQRSVVGRHHMLRLVPGPLATAGEWCRFYERHWTERLDALNDLFPPTAAPPTGDRS
jgi:DNA-binding transcriptional ArsR family regulator